MQDPALIFQNLISPSDADRRSAILQLGWKDDEKFAEDPNLIGDARFYRVNLDNEPDMEAILMANVNNGRRETRVLFFKNEDGGWWCVGSFVLWYMWDPEQAEHMLELRNIVDFDYKDVVIRLRGGGTDIQNAVGLSMYRLHQGRLYRTFTITEDFALRTFPSPGVMTIQDERNSIYHPEPEAGKGAYFVVRRSKQSIPALDWGVVERPLNVIDCIPYRWDPLKYLFVADRSVSGRFCQNMPQAQRDNRESPKPKR